MKKLLLIYVGLMFYSIAGFGQNRLELPRVSGMLGTIKAFSDISVFEINDLPGNSVSEGTSSEIEKYGQISKFRDLIVLDSNLPKISFSEGSMMPIMDFSINNSSNLSIKEISKSYYSKMPITELKSYISSTRIKNK